jgi:hypothetical protein
LMTFSRTKETHCKQEMYDQFPATTEFKALRTEMEIYHAQE